MLWLALHLPQLPLEVHTRASERPLPAVVATTIGNQSQVIGVNGLAARGGVYPGMALAAAHALIAGLHVCPRDSVAEASAIEHLATLAIGYSPMVSLGTQTVLLEIEGSLRLFGGAERLQQRLHAEVRRLGYTPQIAIAPTPLGAELLARAQRESIIRDAVTLRAALHQLPLSVFELPEAAQAALRDLGVRSVRDLMRLPRAGLARRFGAALIDSLDRALGQSPDPRRPFRAPETFRSTLHFPDAVADAEALLFTARRQLLELSAFLQARCAGVRSVRWRLGHWRAAPSIVRVESALVHRNARRFVDLLREQLGRQPLAGSVEDITLEADELLPCQDESASLLPGHAGERTEARAVLVDRLRARLGADAVQGLRAIDDHRPEFAQRLEAASLHAAQTTSGRCGTKPINTHKPATPARADNDPARPTRPLWLLPEPAPLAAPPATPGQQPPWQQVELVLESGPERIETGWWDDRPIARDYYVAHARNGTRMWIYRERAGFTRGRARSRTAPSADIRPQWFLHGLFS
jgi:protein ImuB